MCQQSSRHIVCFHPVSYTHLDVYKRQVEAVLKQTYHKDKFVELLKAKGIDVVFRHTADGRIYGATGGVN